MPAYKFDSLGAFQLWQPSDVGYNPSNLFRNTQAYYFLPNVDEWYKAAFFDPATNQYFDFPTGSDTPPMPVASGTSPGTAVFDLSFEEQGPADIKLAGGPSPFGTVGQAGNAYEWDETELDLVNDDPQALRGLRGFAWLPSSGNYFDLSSSYRNHYLPGISVGTVGFRVGSILIPEPTSLWLMACGTWTLLVRRTCGRMR